jgi:spore coat polysaccharide biosynthesis protein SpsF (cytidylyltransferase family)
MNIIKRIFNKLKKNNTDVTNRIKTENPYIESKLENADIIIGEKENLTREQRRKRFDSYYSFKKGKK